MQPQSSQTQLSSEEEGWPYCSVGSARNAATKAMGSGQDDFAQMIGRSHGVVRPAAYPGPGALSVQKMAAVVQQFQAIQIWIGQSASWKH